MQTSKKGHCTQTQREPCQQYCFLVAYNYDTTYIFVEPIAIVIDALIVTAFDNVFTELTKNGFKPKFNITDNQATDPLTAYMAHNDCKWKFIEPSNHQVNTAERAIYTFKNHFISGLCTTDADWPVQLWDHLATQAVVTVSLLHASHINVGKSAYHQLNGHTYNWNVYPMAPSGHKGITYEDLTSRYYWGTRGTTAWYIGPALDQYRLFNWFVPETGDLCLSGSFDFFHTITSCPSSHQTNMQVKCTMRFVTPLI